MIVLEYLMRFNFIDGRKRKVQKPKKYLAKYRECSMACLNSSVQLRTMKSRPGIGLNHLIAAAAGHPEIMNPKSNNKMIAHCEGVR
ncbi:hypothetical protein NC651_038730 [Populus alba x Populus x berolinensis]|nr:hypothetical protein NC651_038730 [Populus alba x Populus x berolinensis]